MFVLGFFCRVYNILCLCGWSSEEIVLELILLFLLRVLYGYVSFYIGMHYKKVWYEHLDILCLC